MQTRHHHGLPKPTSKIKLGLVTGLLIASGVVIFLIGGGAFHVSEDRHVRTYPIPGNADFSGNKQIRDVVAGGVHDEEQQAHDADLLKDFVNDPSLEVRCKEFTAAPELPQCDPFAKLERKERPLPQLMVPTSTGPTTVGMVLRPSKRAHHPIFEVYANMTAIAPSQGDADVNRRRVLEFNGVHTEYSFDCETGVDFRLYHQCRAALCLEHESRLNATPPLAEEDTSGQFPLVDEEYMEYVMTLTTAYEAARSGSSYTFIELGARYGTWIVRAGASFKSFDPVGQLNLLAVEGNCKWFRKMEEHVRCNQLTQESKLILSYAAPKSYNKVVVGQRDTYNSPRAVSLLEMLPGYEFVDMIDFDIQGFEWLAIEEPGVLELMTKKIGFAHFGTHSTEIEKRVITAMQQHGWCVVYFYAGAHTKKLDRGHRCETPFGPSVFNDGVLGLANLKFYPNLRGKCPKLSLGQLKNVAKTCFHSEDMVTKILERSPHESMMH